MVKGFEGFAYEGLGAFDGDLGSSSNKEEVFMVFYLLIDNKVFMYCTKKKKKG